MAQSKNATNAPVRINNESSRLRANEETTPERLSDDSLVTQVARGDSDALEALDPEEGLADAGVGEAPGGDGLLQAVEHGGHPGVVGQQELVHAGGEGPLGGHVERARAWVQEPRRRVGASPRYFPRIPAIRR